MTRRALVFALALVTVAAPLALTVCQVLCADHGSLHASHPAAAHHSCHGDSVQAAVTMTAVPHACGHATESPAGLEQWVQTVAAPLAVVTPVTLPQAPVAVLAVARPDTVDTSPPGAFALNSQLRV
jgi:hypothetical protein